MTQKTFAACIGVTPKSVEAWEGGRSRPDGAARRLLGLMRDHPGFAENMGIYM
jgi:putative transcriptional regulator